MAGDEYISDSETVKSDGNNENVMKCCKKPCSVLVCVNCFSVFHKSCAGRMQNLEYIGDGRVKCCEKVINEKEENLYKDHYKMEISYLKKLLEEVIDKNNILKMNNQLLNDKICRLEGEKAAQKTAGEKSVQTRTMAQVVASVSNTNPKEIQPVSHDGQNRTEPKKGDHKNKQGRNIRTTSVREYNSDHNKHPVSNNVEYSHVQVTGGNIMRQSSSAAGKDREDMDEYIFPRRRRRFVKRLGQGANDGSGFEGEERKVWLYVHRVKRSVTAEIIEQYIKKKDTFENERIIVKELPTEERQKKCFVVTAPMARKDEMYDPNFWPANVGIKRFDFNKHKDFLNTGGDFL